MIVKDNIITNIRVNRDKVLGRTFSGKEFSKDDVKNLIKQFQHQYKNKNLTLMVSVNTPYGFRSAKSFDIHNKPNLVDNYDWTTTNSFVIYGWKTSNSVGDGENNDCFFQAILKLIGIFRCPKDIKSDKDLKLKLGLNPDEKIPLMKIPIIEKLFKLNINVSGDYEYTSSNKFNQTIYLTCANEHIEIEQDNRKGKELLKHISFKKQHLILVEINSDTVRCYDGREIYNITLDEYYEKSKDFFGEDVYLDDLPLKKSGDIKKDYHNFMNEVDILRNLTGGRINLSKSGYKVSNEALKCIHYDLISYNDPDELTSQEQIWIINTFKGSLIFSSPNVVLPCGYNYDVNSAYPAMLSSDHFSFPLKQGEFNTIDELPTILSYGIYRCIITPSEDEHMNKLFRFNNLHYYTHYDINSARKLNLNIQLIQDTQSNALLYTERRGNGSNFFRHIVYTLYDLKSQSKLAKKIVNAIWGSLSSRNKIKVTTAKEVNLNKGEMILDIKPYGNKFKVTYLKTNKFFKFNYARLGCFLTSAVRKQMTEYIYPVRENIFRCHTDSLLSNIPLEHIPIGNELGKFKCEKIGEVIANNTLEWRNI
jgi:hypothetical protein